MKTNRTARIPWEKEKKKKAIFTQLSETVSNTCEQRLLCGWAVIIKSLERNEK